MRTYFGILSILFLAGGLWLFARRWRVAAGGASAGGEVVGHEARRFDDSVSYMPIVAFTDAQGRRHRFTSAAGGSTRRPPVGTIVTVRYLPEQPEQAYIVSFLHMWAAPLGLFVLGLGALLAWMKD